MAIFFECQGKMFLSIEKVLEETSEDQPQMHCLIVFLHMFEIKVSHFYWAKPEKYNETKLALNSSQNVEIMV